MSESSHNEELSSESLDAVIRLQKDPQLNMDVAAIVTDARKAVTIGVAARLDSYGLSRFNVEDLAPELASLLDESESPIGSSAFTEWFKGSFIPAGYLRATGKSHRARNLYELTQKGRESGLAFAGYTLELTDSYQRPAGSIFGGMATRSPKGLRSPMARVAMVATLLRNGPQQDLDELSQKLDMTPPTVRRYLVDLTAAGLLETDLPDPTQEVSYTSAQRPYKVHHNTRPLSRLLVTRINESNQPLGVDELVRYAEEQGITGTARRDLRLTVLTTLDRLALAGYVQKQNAREAGRVVSVDFRGNERLWRDTIRGLADVCLASTMQDRPVLQQYAQKTAAILESPERLGEVLEQEYSHVLDIGSLVLQAIAQEGGPLSATDVQRYAVAQHPPGVASASIYSALSRYVADGTLVRHPGNLPGEVVYRLPG